MPAKQGSSNPKKKEEKKKQVEKQGKSKTISKKDVTKAVKKVAEKVKRLSQAQAKKEEKKKDNRKKVKQTQIVETKKDEDFDAGSDAEMKNPDDYESSLPRNHKEELNKVKKDILNLAKKPQKECLIGVIEDGSEALENQVVNMQLLQTSTYVGLQQLTVQISLQTYNFIESFEVVKHRQPPPSMILSKLGFNKLTKNFCETRQTIEFSKLWPLVEKFVTVLSKGRSVAKKIMYQREERHRENEKKPLLKPPHPNSKPVDGYKIPSYVDPIVNLLINGSFDDGSEAFTTFKQYATKFFCDNPHQRPHFAQLVFKDVIEASKIATTYGQLLERAAQEPGPIKVMEHISSRSDLLKKLWEDDDNQAASVTALKFLQATLYSNHYTSVSEYTQWFQLSNEQNTLLIKLIEFAGVQHATEAAFEDVCRILGKVHDHSERHRAVRELVPKSLVQGDQKLRCILVGLGDFESPLTRVTASVIEASIDALCHPDITALLSKASEAFLIKVAPFLRKVTGLEGKVEKVRNLFSWFDFPFLSGLLSSLGGSEDVSDASIYYDNLCSTVDQIKVLCTKSPSTYSYFVHQGKNFKGIDAVIDAVSRFNQGVDFELNSGVKDEFVENVKDQLRRDSDYQQIEDRVFDENFTDDFASVFEDLSGLKRRDYQVEALRLIWSLSIDDSFTPLTIQMQVGTGKSFMQSYLGLALTRFDPKNKVLILHTSREVAEQSHRQYAVKDDYSIAMPSDFQFGMRRLVFSDSSDVVNLHKMIHQNRKRLTIIVDEGEKLFDTLIFTVSFKAPNGEERLKFVSTAGMLKLAKHCILFSGTVNFKTQKMLEAASKSASKTLDLNIAKRPRPRLTSMVIYAKGKRQQEVVKQAVMLYQKGSLIIVTDGKEKVDELMTEQNFPGAKLFRFTKAEVKTSSDYGRLLSQVNTASEKVVVYCEEQFGRSTDFKPRVKANVLLAFTYPEYETCVQAIGRGQRSIEASIEAVLLAPPTFSFAESQAEEVIDQLLLRTRDEDNEHEYRAKLCRILSGKKIIPNISKHDINAVIEAINDYDLKMASDDERERKKQDAVFKALKKMVMDSTAISEATCLKELILKK